MSTSIITQKDLVEVEKLLRKLTDLLNQRKIDWVNHFENEQLIEFLEKTTFEDKKPKPYFDFTFAKLGAEPHEIASFVINININHNFGGLFFGILKETPVCCEYVAEDEERLFGTYFFDLLNRFNTETVPGLIRDLTNEIKNQEKILGLIAN